MSQMITLKIKDRKYGMRKMSPLEGGPFGIRVSKLLASILAAPGAKDSLISLQGKFKDKDHKNMDVDGKDTMTIGASIVSLLACVDADELNGIFRKAIKTEVYCGDKNLGDDSEFDMHFQQFPGDLYVVCAWATYNHVVDFFTGLGDGVKALMPASEFNNPDRP